MHPEMREKFSTADYMYLTGRNILDEFTPKDIEAYFHNEGGIIGQDKAVKTAAILIHRHFQHGCASVTLFCGPTGSGKTQIWRAAQKYLSDHNVVIHDASTLTAIGWKGHNTIDCIFKSMKPDMRERCILCLDEADKIFEPQFGSNGTNYSDILQNQLLKLFDHDKLFFGSEEGRGFTVDCKHVSIVLLGSFQRLLEAKSLDTHSIGFGANPSRTCTYGNTEITTDDLLKFTSIREEIAGRIDRIVCMEPLSVQDYIRIMLNHIEDVSKQVRVPIDIDQNALLMIARSAINGKLGARWANHQIDAIIDEMIYEDPYATRLVYQYEPPDADEKRQTACME